MSLKLVVIGIFVLILLIPSEMVQSLIRERETTRNVAISEIWRTWGDRQVLAGPVVSVPVVSARALPNGTFESSTRFLQDVYKRQALYCTNLLPHHQLRQSVRAVSYTHLDVYKRQVQAGPSSFEPVELPRK